MTIRFRLTPDDAVAAGRLFQRRRLRLIASGSLVLAVLGLPLWFGNLAPSLGLAFLGAGIAGLVLAVRLPGARRAATRAAGPAFEEETVVTIGPAGVRQELGDRRWDLGWSEVSGMRSDSRTILLLRDSLPAVVIPRRALGAAGGIERLAGLVEQGVRSTPAGPGDR